MKNKTFKVLAVLSIITFVACSLNSKEDETKKVNVLELNSEVQETEPHRYGGWYCPDNLGGFPPVDIANWQNVPVINGRMATQEETRTEASLIFVDNKKYPNAKPLDMTMPKLAKIYNEYSKREDIIIVIQAINVTGDSIVGYRFLNGGNGSARLKEVNFISDYEISMLPNGKFVSHSIDILANQETISKVLTKLEHTKKLQTTFKNNTVTDWRKTTNVNYQYANGGMLANAYADILFGNFYVQNDFKHLQYTEKFLVLEDQESRNSKLQIVCGPFADDFEAQKTILINWAAKVKALSEN